MPLEVERFQVRVAGRDGKPRAVGFVAPYSREDAVGAALSMQFY